MTDTSCVHFQQVGPSSYITHTATVGPWNCPWCEIAQLRGTLSLAEEGLANYAQENEQLRAALREVYEVWAGSDGFVPQTAAEGYQQRLILQMRDAAARGLGKP